LGVRVVCLPTSARTAVLSLAAARVASFTKALTMALLMPLLLCSPALAADLPPSFTLRAVRFEGATRFTTAELQAIAAPFLNKALRPLDLEELRQRVTRAYVERGHVNSGAVLEPGALQEGMLTLRIVEGRIGRVQQRGLQGLTERYLDARLRREGEVFEVGRLQERFQLQLADPLFARLNARLLPDDEPGQAVLDVEVTRAPPWQLALFAHNHVAPAVGSTQVGFEGVWRNLLGWGDAAALTLAGGAASDQTDASWLLPLFGSRTTLTLRAARGASSVVEEPVASLDITSRISTREATLVQPLVDEPRQRWAVGLTHSARHNRTRLAGFAFGFVPGEPEGGIRLESWRLFQEVTVRRDRDVHALRVSALYGRNNLVPEPLLPEQPPVHYRVWQLQGQSSLATSAAGDEDARGGPLLVRLLLQRSPDRLVPLERLAVGGRYTVRGYRENQLVRDNGWAVGLEWPWRVWQDTAQEARFSVAPVADIGEAWNRGEAKSRLASAGIGLLWTQGRLDAELYLARRLERRDNPTSGDLQDHGIHFQLRWRPPQ
jgi:hemolysin activation/secretion protein